MVWVGCTTTNYHCTLIIQLYNYANAVLFYLFIADKDSVITLSHCPRNLIISTNIYHNLNV